MTLERPSELRVICQAGKDADPRWYFVHRRVSAKGRTSGVPLEGDVYHCCWLRHGRFIRVEDHLTAKGALHALGLSGETLEATGLRE